MTIRSKCPWCKKITQETVDWISPKVIQKTRNGEEYITQVCETCKQQFEKGKKPMADRNEKRRGSREQTEESEEKTTPAVISTTEVRQEVPELEPEDEKTMSIAELENEDELGDDELDNLTKDPEPEIIESFTDTGMQWGIIGTGQGGSRLAEAFAKFGYPVCVINTSQQDLAPVKIPDENKLLMEFALGGVGKDIRLGAQAANQNRDAIKDLMDRTFKDNVDAIIITVGLGGGTGSGSAITIVTAARAYKVPVLVLATLPMSSEGSTTKHNALQTLDKLANAAKREEISGLIVIDNARIELLYPNVKSLDLWNVANSEIVSILHAFNWFSNQETSMTAFDPMDFARVITTGNCTIYGKTKVEDYMDEQAIATAVLENVKDNVLAEGFDLSEAVRVGVIIAGTEKALNQIPAINLNYGFSVLNEVVGAAEVFRGVYTVPEDTVDGDYITVYAIFSGLGLPKERIRSLIKESKEQIAQMKIKVADKTKMNVLDEHRATEVEETVYTEMREKRTDFGGLVNRKKNNRSRG